ncbi:hypothetical protein HK102_002937 [Quaeritorhiza haematococci]|nr:hypothetical protein HK102_002937 [Quaeritorhiza haematococci]
MATPISLDQLLEIYNPPDLVRGHASSSSRTTAPSFPRGDLWELRYWNDFPTYIQQVKQILAAKIVENHLRLPRSIRLDYVNKVLLGDATRYSEQKTVTDESAIVAFSDSNVHEILEYLMGALGDAGAKGSFVSPSGQKDVVGDPDRVWLVESTRRAKVVVEYKTWWALPVNGDIISVWERFQPLGNQKGLDLSTRHTGNAISQVYGYSTFNFTRYCVLSTYQATWFFQRVQSDEGGLLQVWGPVRQGRQLLEA